MNGPLNGCKVLVTRPRDQSERLCRLIELEGGEAIAFPTLELSPSPEINRHNLLALFANATHIIFISRNAVRFANHTAGDLAMLMRGKQTIAVGEGTLRELNAHEVMNVASPGARSGSEELLNMPELAPNVIAGCEVLIVRGDSGRELLSEQLRERGARVTYANVYQRTEPPGGRDRLRTLWREKRPDVITITSEQGLASLIRMTADEDREIMSGCKVVVMSPRLVAAVATAGFRGQIYVATEQSDAGLLQAIRQTVE